MPKHPPLREPPPKSICPTPKQIRPGTLKGLSRHLAGFKALSQKQNIIKQTSNTQYKYIDQAPACERNILNAIPKAFNGSKPFSGGRRGEADGHRPPTSNEKSDCEIKPAAVAIAIAIAFSDRAIKCTKMRVATCLKLILEHLLHLQAEDIPTLRA